jgi:hypothetical protein
MIAQSGDRDQPGAMALRPARIDQVPAFAPAIDQTIDLAP